MISGMPRSNDVVAAEVEKLLAFKHIPLITKDQSTHKGEILYRRTPDRAPKMEASSSSSYRTSRETDLKGWRLKVGEDNHGQHKWVYLPEGAAREASPQTKADKYAIGLEMVCPPLRSGISQEVMSKGSTTQLNPTS